MTAKATLGDIPADGYIKLSKGRKQRALVRPIRARALGLSGAESRIEIVGGRDVPLIPRLNRHAGRSRTWLCVPTRR